MKKALSAAIFVIVFPVFCFEIVVSSTRTDSFTVSETAFPTEFEFAAPSFGLALCRYQSGGAMFLSAPGLSSAHTNFVFKGITLNDPATGTFDLSSFPAYLSDVFAYFPSDSSSLWGGRGIGGTVFLDLKMKDRFKADMLLEENASRFVFIAPLSTGRIKMNLMYQGNEGNSKRENSGFRKNFIGAALEIGGAVTAVLNFSDERTNTPGPLVNALDPFSATYPLDKMEASSAFFLVAADLGKTSLAAAYRRYAYTYENYYYGSLYRYGGGNSYFRMAGNAGIADGPDIKAGLKFSIRSEESGEKKNLRGGLGGMLFFKGPALGFEGRFHLRDDAPAALAGSMHWHYMRDLHELFLDLSRGIRQPELNDLYFPGSGNPELKEEKSVSFTVKYAYSFLSGRYSHREIEDMIAWVLDDPLLYLYSPKNIAKAVINEAVLTAEKKAGPLKFKETFAYNWGHQERVYDPGMTCANITRTYPATYLPDIVNTFSASLEFRGMELAAEHLYRGRMSNIYNGAVKTIGPVRVLNIMLRAPLRNSFFEIGVKNALDARGSGAPGDSFYDGDYPIAGRTFYARLSI